MEAAGPASNTTNVLSGSSAEIMRHRPDRSQLVEKAVDRHLTSL
jgi:hypothetical protein